MSRFGRAINVVRAVSVLVLAAAMSGVLLTAGAEATGPFTLTVNNTAAGTVSTQLSTNNVWSGLVSESATATANFRALSMPLVRIHVGDDGYPIAMPETKQGSWSFAALDKLVNDSFNSGQAPLMNIKFAPDWQWTCTTLYTAGTVRDQTFTQYADYMARLVSYYNKGSMTTEAGTLITNPAGTSHRIVYWEPWNEPDLNNETPCAPSTGVGLTPTQYVTMWNAVTAKMLAVDPGLRFIGPATAGGQFGSGTDLSQDYFTPLMKQSVKPIALSFHGYGYWDNTVSDQTIFNGDGTGYPDGGIDDMVATVNRLRNSFPTTPIWLDEMNVNSDWGNDTHKRPWTQLGAAWWGAAYAALAPLHVEMLHQYDVMDAPQFGLLNDQTGAPFLPYWEFKLLNQSFPVGSTLLQSSSPSTNIPVIAAARADGKITIMVANRTVDPSAPAAGLGLAADVVVSLSGMSPTAISLQQIDSATSVTTGAVVTSLPVSNNVSLHFPGYGFAVITVSTADTAPVAPSAPTLTAATAAGAQVALGWTPPASNGGSAVTSYRIYRGTAAGGEALLTTVGVQTAYTDMTAADGTTYYYQVSAVSAAGESARSNELAAAPVLPADTSAPSVSISSPTTGTTVAGAVAVSASASDDVGVSKVVFSLDGTAVATSTNSPYGFSWNTAGVAVGSHTLSATAYDAAGNHSSSSISVTVQAPADTTAPILSIGSPVDGATVAGSVAVSASASDDVAVAMVVFSLDGVPTSTQTVAPYDFSWDTTTVADGSHTLTATASDAAGNSSSASIAVSVRNAPTPPGDTTAPSTPSSLKALLVGTTQVAIAWAPSTDNVGVDHYDVYRDGTVVGQALLPNYLDTGLNPATRHKYKLVAVDAAGNRSLVSSGLSAKTASSSATATTGTLGCVVYDDAGHALANAAVVISGNGITKSATSGGSGAVKFSTLKPADYTVTITRPTSSPSTVVTASVLAGQTVLTVAP